MFNYHVKEYELVVDQALTVVAFFERTRQYQTPLLALEPEFIQKVATGVDAWFVAVGLGTELPHKCQQLLVRLRM